MILNVILFVFLHILFIAILLSLIVIVRKKLLKKFADKNKDIQSIGFLHPNCNDCGGGERVLWMMIKSFFLNNSNYGKKKLKLLIYAANETPSSKILDNIKSRFNIEFENLPKINVHSIQIVRIKSGFLLNPKSFLTMVIQIIGQIIFAFEILITYPSSFYIDSTGLPFTYSILSFFGNGKIIAYVHYPFISSDMIKDVEKNVSGVHSRGILSKFSFFRELKVYYYKLILIIFKFNGKFPIFSYCNSSWTYDHIIQTWGKKENKKRLYPPCAIDLYSIGESTKQRKLESNENIIVSFAQFRPEKNHKLQIEIFKKIKEKNEIENLSMVIIGSIRHEGDRQIFDELNEIVRKYDLQNQIRFEVNLRIDDVKRIFDSAKVGIHTMKDEHFGITIVEMIAAGLLVFAHKSAGPLKDIIGPAPYCVGYLCETLDEYVESITNNLKLYKKNGKSILAKSIEWAGNFSDEAFTRNFFTDIDADLKFKE